MTTPLTENRAVQDPHAALTRRQQAALAAIAKYKNNRLRAGAWEIGGERFSPSIIDVLKHRRIVQERRATFGPVLSLTLAGQMAAERLKERQQ